MSKQQIIKNKKKALNYFTRQILSSPIKERIDKIILYGSLVYGEPREESDIDLVIIGKERRNTLANKLSDTSFETLLKYGEMVEPMVYSLKDYQRPKSAFLTEAIKYGQEIYSN